LPPTRPACRNASRKPLDTERVTTRTTCIRTGRLRSEAKTGFAFPSPVQLLSGCWWRRYRRPGRSAK
jgi:hypothetical protein